jgi:hypothetical protein
MSASIISYVRARAQTVGKCKRQPVRRLRQGRAFFAFVAKSTRAPLLSYLLRLIIPAEEAEAIAIRR